jgi:dTDP-4-amino-4,6-dideoxygalactose transaminase
MNLPAPPYELFKNLLDKYEAIPDSAIADFEAELKVFFDVHCVTTFTNCFTALSISLLYACKGRHKTVAIAGLSYRRTVDIVLWAGLEPLFIDNSYDDLAMSTEGLVKALETSKIGCVLMQHPMVKIGGIDRYIEICKSYGVPIVFDSVEATGASYKSLRVGRFGVAEGFSLHPSKVINGAEGGVLTFGSSREYECFQEFLVEIGICDALTRKKTIFGLEPMHAIMGMASLQVYNEVSCNFKSHYERYLKNLKGATLFELIEYDMDANPNFKSILMRIINPNLVDRSDLLIYLESNKIGARAYYSPLHSLSNKDAVPNAIEMSKNYFILPIGHTVTIDDIDFISEKLYEYEQSILRGV